MSDSVLFSQVQTEGLEEPVESAKQSLQERAKGQRGDLGLFYMTPPKVKDCSNVTRISQKPKKIGRKSLAARA